MSMSRGGQQGNVLAQVQEGGGRVLRVTVHCICPPACPSGPTAAASVSRIYCAAACPLAVTGFGERLRRL